MAKVIGKDKLCRIDNFREYFIALQGIQNKTLFDRYDALRNVVKNNIEIGYRDFLAYPVGDGDTITFHGKKYNETPQILSELQGEEFEKYTKRKNDAVAHYNQKIDQLRSSGKAVEAEFLADATKYVDDRFVYCYDDNVVLGVWGMKLRDNVRGDISEICKDLTPEKTKNPKELTEEETESTSKDGSEEIQDEPKPEVPPPVPPPVPKLPWYRRFGNWLTALFAGKGCLRWLLRLLLFLLLLMLLLWLLRNCNGCSSPGLGGGAALGDNDSAWVHDDPRVGHGGGKYDPNNPYTPVPTLPGYEHILPPQEGVLPPLGENPDIIPGNPNIIANRLNILMENEDKTIMDFAKAFKTKYPNDKYKVVYYDNVVKRMQIEIPREERESLKQTIPVQFAPEYELFVFDESLFEGTYTPNDPALNDPNKSWYLKAINAPPAWDLSRGSEKITVAVVDNGFSLKHPELNSKIIQPYNVWKHSNEIFPQQVDHGTHVAGTALAIADNGEGIAGIAPNCRFMPVQVADERGIMTITSVLDGILYALYQGADVINVSLTSQFSTLARLPKNIQEDMIRNRFKEEERLWREVMRIAAKHNATVILAAGNENVLAGIDALQRPELFITVSAVDKNNQNFTKAGFSNYGQYSTISAPGVGIYSTVGENGYQSFDGTSMAAPIVAGAVALMKSINPNKTTKQIICILQETGLNTQGNIGKLIQLNKAMAKVKSGEVVDCTPVPSTGDVQVLLNWNNYNDLDLICRDPSGESISFQNLYVKSGGQLEIDMNVEYPDSKKPMENIFWEPGTAPSGTYNVYLVYYHKHEPSVNETPYHVKVRYGGKTDEYDGVIKQEDKVIHVCSFTLGSATIGNQPVLNPNIPTNDERRKQLEQERSRLKQELDRVNDELRRIGNSR